VAVRLPVPSTSFVNRDAELAELCGLVRSSRLVTVTGAAGLGKTRLAIEVAGRGPDQGVGEVRFASLAALTDGALVAPEVAARIGVREQAGEPVLDTLSRHIDGRRMLLFLDNCEHLVDASARLVEVLLRECAELHVLATSRQPLRVPGEVVWRIAPLTGHAALQLFEDRARVVRPRFRLGSANSDGVGLVCRRLDGIPLAIELAAARMGALSVGEVLARLEDRFRLLRSRTTTGVPRHRTLQAALDWGHGLLDERERWLFRRVSVFSGGFDLASAEAVCTGDGLEPSDVGGLVFRLVERSLLVPDTGGPGPTRYRLLETVRQYGAARLARSGELPAVAERHAAHHLALAEAAGRAERGADQPGWLRRLESDLGNLRVALGWLRSRDVDRCLHMAGVLSWFWETRGHFAEGRRWLEGALAEAATAAPSRAAGLLALGRLCMWQGDYPPARAACAGSLELCLGRGDHAGCAWALIVLGSVDAYEGAYAISRQHFERALAVAGDDHLRMEALVGMGEMLIQAGEFSEARVRLTEIERLSSGPDAPRGRAALFRGLAALFSAEYAEATEQLSAALRSFHRQGNRYAAAGALDGLAGLAVVESDPARALRLEAAAEALRQATQSQLAPRWRELIRTGIVEPATAALGDRAAETWAEGAGTTFDEAVRAALDREPAPPPGGRPAGGPAGLTPREEQVAELVADGLTNRQISERLFISERTAEGHVERIRAKLNVRSRAQIAAMLRGQPAPDD
jgi:non-specific serine/threonine protein kinase